jgi:hypothetical protein
LAITQGKNPINRLFPREGAVTYQDTNMINAKVRERMSLFGTWDFINLDKHRMPLVFAGLRSRALQTTDVPRRADVPTAACVVSARSQAKRTGRAKLTSRWRAGLVTERE